ncbi:MAG: ribonuclease H [Actinomycetota bacterium]
MPHFTCTRCGAGFTLSQSVIDRYPGWTPKLCMSCKDSQGGAARKTKANAVPATDPTTGVFTDGSAVPNPGEGGWGAVFVIDGEVVAQNSGYGGQTTNNRMELTALIHAADLVPVGTTAQVYSDSNLAVRTINEWAAGWEKRGWRRKSGPVENVDLVKVAYEKYKARPELSLVWIKAHVGFTWNEYADELANRARVER